MGTSVAIPIDARIIAATNRTLSAEVEAGRFREDLYYRLNVVEIHLPSLAQRRDDIPHLVEHFLEKYRTAMRKKIRGVSSDAMRALMAREWKGEIRELENVVERAVIFCDGDMLTAADLQTTGKTESVAVLPAEELPLSDAIGQFEKQYILATLKSKGNDKEATAQLLKVSLATLYRRIKDLGIVL